uniref:H/ACA ribonucleoprotein complex non-core subunit NAF1 n=1 Tax=Salmo trutta TaxID=8032 RepID=A0A673ZVM2_SALTR
MEAQPEETAVVPEVLQSSAETHREELELNNGTSTEHREEECTAETEPQGLTSVTSDSRLPAELTGGAEEMEVTENLNSVSSSELGDGTTHTHLPKDVSLDPSQNLPLDPPQDPSQNPPQNLPQDPPQNLPHDPPQDLPQVLLTLQDGVCVRDQRDGVCVRDQRDGVCVRVQRDGSSSSSDSDSDSSSSGVTLAVVLGQADDEDDDDEGFSRTKKPCSIKTLDEILPEELPAVEELTVVLPEEAEILPLGSVTSIIQQLVIIQSFKDTPPLKDDSVIFNSDRLAVGKVFEVFGPVSSPFYVLRFNSESDITERGVKLKDSMFYAPSLTDYTLYILTEQLRRSVHTDYTLYIHTDYTLYILTDYTLYILTEQLRRSVHTDYTLYILTDYTLTTPCTSSLTTPCTSSLTTPCTSSLSSYDGQYTLTTPFHTDYTLTTPCTSSLSSYNGQYSLTTPCTTSLTTPCTSSLSSYDGQSTLTTP